MSRLPSSNDRGYAAIAAVVRLVTLAIGVATLLPESLTTSSATSIAALAVVALAATIVGFLSPQSPWVSPVEAALSASAIALAGDSAAPLLPYVAVPAFTAGLLGGFRRAVAATASGAVVLLVLSLPYTPASLAAVVTWLLAALGVGLLAGWVHLLRARTEAVEQHSYEEASRLLDDLRRVIRPLAGGLDPRPLAEAMVHEIADQVPCTGAAVFLGQDSSRELVATCGATTSEDWAAWRTTAPALEQGRGIRVSATPIRHSGNDIGLLVMAADPPLTKSQHEVLSRITDSWSPRLEAARLYYEVRDIATRAERSRIAREMHDGVAQDIASLGYLVDDMAADAPPELSDKIDALRSQLSRVVSDLRLSIHDLRLEGLRSSGLAASLAELARREAQSGGMRLHLRVQEGVTNTPEGVEHDLYRIVQEALTNARRHSQAENLWLSCVIGPGGTVITVQDDGVGTAGPSPKGLGIQTITERAMRIGASLTMEARRPNGTMLRVEYTNPSGDRAAS
jgi:signal transduction histidine kinase